MRVLGISCYFHDAAAALVDDGRLIAAAEEERFSRQKHDAGFPAHAIEFCLRTAGISASELDRIVFYEEPFLRLERLLVSALWTFPRSRRQFQEAMISWLGDKIWVRHQIEDRLGVPASRIFFTEHHTSHAASAFLASPFEDAAILTADGVGEWTTTSIAVGSGTDIRVHEEIRFPHSLGLFYSAFTAFLGFEVNEGEYKVMGLAPYGQPRYIDQVRKLVRLQRDGTFELDLDYFAFQNSTDRTFSGRFVDLFGQPRRPDADWRPYADLAASVQAVTEEAMLGLARRARERTGLTKLCLAGGVALNSVANARLLRESGFDEIYVQPAAGDSGGALGAALLGSERRGFVMDHAGWGAEYPNVRDVLRAEGAAFTKFNDEQQLLDRVVELLVSGRVVGWFQGRFEWGPRSLGNRSILADPRRADMKDRVNSAVKFREPFRPFAPSVTADCAGTWFGLERAAEHYPARFMLYVVPVREDRRAAIPAVTHVDGSARVQVVRRGANPRFHRLLETFGAATGVPVLLNTSFNVRREPIVASPADALRTWRASGLDAVVLENCLVEKVR
ncbi:MAG TPA: carbamoyltransferase N-terminal domain-containing protein [Bryobacteraceae bacterium]|nr:carbamoyltransferase N-terminal domain-containing protein [Bryobacteraceae bacterium]